MITLYGKLLENIADDKNLFDSCPYTEERITFFRESLLLIKNIVKKELNFNQKKLLILFLEGRGIYDISKIFQRSHGTIHQNYNLIVKKISLNLISNEKFFDIIKKLPEYSQEKILEWIDDVKEKYNIVVHKCPICGMKFKNKYQIKTHIFKINDKEHKKYYREQLDLIHRNLKRYGFRVDWIYKMDDKLLFSLSWIYSLWEKQYGKKTKGNIFKVFKFR